MDQIRWQQIGTIVDQALSLDTPEERTALVKQLCGDDEILRKEVTDWLDSIASSKGLWNELLLSNQVLMDDMTLSEAPALSDSTEKIPTKIGLYKIKKRLGRGGMGDIYLAERTKGDFHGNVALKVIRSEVGSNEQVRRFLQERTLLSRLNHPNIARLLDGGVSGDGRPYFVLEYVDGMPITEYCEEHACSLKERLALFGQVCEAVQYAHSNFIVHRDLKPDNLLVTSEGNVKVLDFGIAKLLDQKLSEQTLLQTRSGQRLLSLNYAAPEQLTMAPITAATDVYALGLLLYELLSGSHPFDLTGKTLVEAEQIIRNQEPVKPSAAATKWHGKLAGDLDTIMLKALRKEPDQRYESASRLWEDIEHYLESRPVRARKGTLRYRAGKFARRNQTILAAAVLFFIAAAGFGSYHAHQLNIEREITELEAEKAKKTTEILTGLFTQANPQRAQKAEITAREILDIGTKKISTQLQNQPEVHARVLGVLGHAYFNINLLHKADSLLSQALKIYQNLDGEQRSGDFAYAQWVMGNIKSGLGNYNDAEKHMRTALAIYRENEGENAAETKQGLLDLGLILHEKRNFEESSAKIDEWASKRADEDDAEYASRLIDEGQIAFITGNHEESVKKTRKALAIRMDLYGEHHAFTAIAMDRLSGTLSYGDLYHSAEAESLQAKAVSINSTVYDEPHEEWAYSIFKLGLIYKIRGNYEESKNLFQQAIEMMQQVRGDKNPYTLNIKLKYAHLLTETKELDTARTLYQELETIYTEKYSREYWFSIECRERLAFILKKENKLDEAEELFRNVINDYNNKYGQIHEHSIIAHLNYGHVLLLQGNHIKAEKWIKESIDFLRQSKADVKLKLALSERILGHLRTEQQRFEEAEELLKNSYKFFEQTRTRESNYTKESLEFLITLYEVWDKPDKAREYKTLTAKSEY